MEKAGSVKRGIQWGYGRSLPQAGIRASIVEEARPRICAVSALCELIVVKEGKLEGAQGVVWEALGRSGARKRAGRVEGRVIERLWARCDASSKCRGKKAGLAELCEKAQKALERKLMSCRRESSSYAVTPDFCALWRLTARVTCELFAGCANESGALGRCCSREDEDMEFGALGKWEDVEELASGRASSSPFEKEPLQRMIERIEAAVRPKRPCCRAAIAPAGKRHGILAAAEVDSLAGEALALMWRLWVTLHSGR